MSDALGSLRSLIGRFCDVNPEHIQMDSVLNDLPGWGSLAALQLLAAIEREYAVSFEVREYLLLITVAEIAGTLEEKGVTFGSEPAGAAFSQQG